MKDDLTELYNGIKYEFKANGDTITYTETMPNYDEKGNKIEGKVLTITLVYKKA